MRVIIAGGGEFGTRLAESLERDRHEVVLIEKNEKRAESLGERLSCIVMYADASDKEMLRKVSAEKADAVMAVTGDDKVNSLICEAARSLGVKRVIARLNDPDKESMLASSGAFAINIVDSAVREFRKAAERKRA
jgi:trk system potassium uptake protein TrkA